MRTAVGLNGACERGWVGGWVWLQVFKFRVLGVGDVDLGGSGSQKGSLA